MTSSPAIKPPKLYGFGPGEGANEANIEIYEGAPETISLLHDVIFVPESNCLFDRGGRRIPETSLYRRSSLRHFGIGPEQIDRPEDLPRLTGRYLYLQNAKVPHWGHFLLEGTSRLWAPKRHAEFSSLPLLHHRMGFDGPWPTHLADAWEAIFARFFCYCGIDTEKLFCPDQAVILDEVIVPAPSFVIRNHAFSIHAAIHERAARQALGSGDSRWSDAPIYLSRSRLPLDSRRVVGEEKLEAILSNAGVRVVHPEIMEIEEQMRLFNTHRIFIGCEGSAFHCTLFGPADGKTITVVLTSPLFSANYLMVDALKKLDAHYVSCLTRQDDSNKIWRARDHILDLDRAVHFLREMRIL